MPLKVIGSGMGRTGTHTLKIALEQLGFGKCYHMVELLKKPSDLIYFKAAEEGRPVEWDKMFEGFQSAVDYPCTRYHTQLMKQYPEAKVVHTIREPESWYKSASETIFWASKPSAGRVFNMMIRAPFSKNIRQRMPVLQYNGKLLDWEFGDITDKDAVLKRYNDYNEKVVASIPKDRLLVYNVKDGWEPLCRFLEVPVPAEPLPRTNTKEGFIKGVKILSKGGPIPGSM
ncbi:MAG TPA: sulfotransferase [Chitinophagaceae bacterium]|jgi:hypothetical protein|nr:sulfotransferase [Chitinophagaceae bacterium]